MSLASDSERLPPPVRKGPNWQSIGIQGAVGIIVIVLAWAGIGNLIDNIRAKPIPTNFDFLWQTAGFDINQSLIEYNAKSSYFRAFAVGLLNTLTVSALGIVFATIIGFVVGIARLSQNWLASKLAAIYVETLRNTPLLLQLLFWYNAVLAALPGPRQSLKLPAVAFQFPSALSASLVLASLATAAAAMVYSRRQFGGSIQRMIGRMIGSLCIFAAFVFLMFGADAAGIDGNPGVLAVREGAYSFLNSKGLYIPFPQFGAAGMWLPIVTIGAMIGALGFTFWARMRQAETGRQLPVFWINLVMIVLPPLLIVLAAGNSVTIDYPQLRRFDFAGGLRLYPEFFALLLGLSLYTASFIAEIVRAGILAVSKGQTEAAAALGLRPSQTLKLVVIPQAMRVVIPPLTNQYLNLTKNSSLAVFIGFPELVHIFLGTVLFQTGAAIQIVAMTMAVYLVISLATSMAMNVYNSRMALAER